MSKADEIRRLRESQAERKVVPELPATRPAPDQRSGAGKIVEGLREAITDNLTQVTIDGEVWRRGECPACAARRQKRTLQMRAWRKAHKRPARKRGRPRKQK